MRWVTSGVLKCLEWYVRAWRYLDPYKTVISWVGKISMHWGGIISTNGQIDAKQDHLRKF
jgi:hypothetical protein